MSAWTKGTYTRKGLSLLSKLTQGSSLEITKAVSGSGYVSPEILANQTAVSGVKQHLSFEAASYPEVGTCKLPMFLTNKGLASGYKARQIGLYAMDPNEGEILFFISQSEGGTDVPSESVMPDYSAKWTFYLKYGQADDVNVTVDPSHTVNEDMLNEVRAIAETGVSAPNLGEVLSLKNTANLPFAGLRILGKTTQNGTPSPSNPVELVSACASGGVTVSVYEKNLFEPLVTTKTLLDVTVTKTNDGNYVVDGTASGNIWIELGKAYLVAGHEYTLSASELLNVQIWDSTANKALTGKPRESECKTFVANNTGLHGICLSAYSNKEDVYSNVTANIMLGAGTRYSAWRPYITAQTLTLSTPNGLPGIPVKSGGNYRDENGQEWLCDEIDLARGVKVQRTRKMTMSSGDSIQYSLSGKTGRGQLIVSPHVSYSKLQSINGVMCNMATKTEIALEATDGEFYENPANVVLVGATGESEDAIKKKYAALEFLYILSTPIETPLTAEEMIAYNALKSNNPHTTIINDGSANIEADCFLARHEAGLGRLFDSCLREVGALQLPVSRTYYASWIDYFIGGQKMDSAGGVYLEGVCGDDQVPTPPEWASEVISLMQCKVVKISFDCSASWARSTHYKHVYDVLCEGVVTCNVNRESTVYWSIDGEATQHLPRLAVFNDESNYGLGTAWAQFLELPTQFLNILRDYDYEVKQWGSGNGEAAGSTAECGTLTITGYN